MGVKEYFHLVIYYRFDAINYFILVIFMIIGLVNIIIYTNSGSALFGYAQIPPF